MTRLRIKRITALQLAALTSVALALPLAASQAAPSSSPGRPLVATAGATRVSPPSADLHGSIDPRTLSTTYYFEYGPTTAYGSRSTVGTLPGGTAKVKVSETVTGIQLGYHYRLVATNADGTRRGRDRTIGSTVASAFTLPKTFQPTPLGSAFILNGTLTGAGNGDRPVVLQASPYPYRTAYADVGSPIDTDAHGGFSFRVPRLTVSTKFRVATVGARPLYSPVVPELVTVRVLLKVRSSKSAPGLVRLYGTVTPAAVGAHVFLQLEKAPKGKGRGEKPPRGEVLIRPEKTHKRGKGKKGGKSEKSENSEKLPTYATKYVSVVKRGTKTISRFSMVVRITTAGNYRVYVVIPPGPVASGHSQTVTLRAVPGSGKRKKKSKRK